MSSFLIISYKERIRLFIFAGFLFLKSRRHFLFYRYAYAVISLRALINRRVLCFPRRCSIYLFIIKMIPVPKPLIIFGAKRKDILYVPMYRKQVNANPSGIELRFAL